MTDLSPAALKSWSYSINYGPDGEANYAFVYDSDGALVSNLKMHHAIAVVEQMNRRTASAPEEVERPLSSMEAGAVKVKCSDGVERTLVEWLKNFQRMTRGTGYLHMAKDAGKLLSALDPSPASVPAGRVTDEMVEAILARGMPFGFDPATGYFHADDGAAPAGAIFYEPKVEHLASGAPSPDMGKAVEAVARAIDPGWWQWADQHYDTNIPGDVEARAGQLTVAARALRAAAAALAKPSSVEGWRTMDSAPTDGTHFLAYETTGEMYRAAYHPHGYVQSLCGQPAVETPKPEYWLPLDALPERPTSPREAEGA